MLQTWIIRADLPPTEAAKTGDDASVCGDCRLRNGACYVTLHHGPRAVYAAYHRGAYAIGGRGRLVLGRRPRDPVRRVRRSGSGPDARLVPAGSESLEMDGIFASMARPQTAAAPLPLDGERRQRRRGLGSERPWLAQLPGAPPRRAAPASRIPVPRRERIRHRTTCDRCAQCDGARLVDLRRSYSVIVHGSGASAFKRSRLPIL